MTYQSIYINYTDFYVPGNVLDNSHFGKLGLTGDDIISKSGIVTRRRVEDGENTNTMAIEAIKKGIEALPYPIQEVDLIIGATYTPFDTIYSVSHAVQQYFDIAGARCFTVDAACSSSINAIESAICYILAKKATKVLVVCSDNNSAYNNGMDKTSGFLWGDGAAVAFLSSGRYSDHDIEVVDIVTTGLGNIGFSSEGVVLQPNNGGLRMPNGRDVFHHACSQMINGTSKILKDNELDLGDIVFFIPHQANKRITNYVAKQLGLPHSKVLSNIEQFGNTGCAGSLIALAQHQRHFRPSDNIVVSVFGGGYSSGTMLLRQV